MGVRDDRPLPRYDLRGRDLLPTSAHPNQHRNGNGSDFCARYGLTRLVWAERGDDVGEWIAHEKRLKKWRPDWKFALVERGNPEWRDLFDEAA